MKQSTALTISIALTVFVIAVIAGVLWTVRAAAAQKPDPAPQAISPELQKQISDRESAYQNLIDQANARIEQLQKEQQDLKAQLTTQQSTSLVTATQTAVTPHEAAQIASKYLNRTDVYSIETSTTNGLVNYRVTFSSGDIVIVSSAGQVVSVTPASTVAAASSAPSSGGGHEGHDSHEGGDDHGD